MIINKINHDMTGYFYRTNDFRKNNDIDNDDINNKNIQIIYSDEILFYFTCEKNISMNT